MLSAFSALALVFAGNSAAAPAANPPPRSSCGHHLEVRIMDPKGAPVPHARVRFAWETGPEGTPMLTGNGAMTMEHGIFEQPKQLSDDRGVALCGNCCDSTGSYRVEVDADGYATGSAEGLSRDSVVVIRLGRGANVRGRVTRGGVPVAGARVNMEGGYELTTEADGTYEYAFLIPQSSYVLYTPMDHGQSAGGTQSVYVVTGPNGSTIQARDLHAGPVHTLRGVLVVPRGLVLPPRFLLYWERTIQSQRARDDYIERPYLHVEPNGRFEITGLPEQRVRLSLGYTSWKFASNPPAPFRRNADGMELSWDVHSDLSDVRLPIVLEPPKPDPDSDTSP